MRRMYNRLMTATFPLRAGIPVVALDQLIGSEPTVEIKIRALESDRRAGSVWDLIAVNSLAKT